MLWKILTISLLVRKKSHDSHNHRRSTVCILGVLERLCSAKFKSKSPNSIFSRISTAIISDTPHLPPTLISHHQDWFLIIDLHGGPSSAISKVAEDATSYAHRNALLKLQFFDRVNTGSYPADGFSFLNGWVASITDTSEFCPF